MQMRNFTPFEPLLFESEGHRGLPFSVAVLKGRFSIQVEGRLDFLEPGKITFSDELLIDPKIKPSSVIRESNLAPLKMSTDIHFINPVAHSPNGIPAPRWDVEVTAGPIQKKLCVTGPRHWRAGPLGWVLSKPEFATTVEMVYENSLGGWWQRDGKSVVCKENPVGKGFDHGRFSEEREKIDAPQIEDPAEPIEVLCQPTRPQGLGPIARGWEPRLKLAGTFDDRWLEERWPQIPDDYDFAHNNSAHPDLIAPCFFSGIEFFEIRGLSPRSLQFRLPGLRVYFMLRYEDGEIAPIIPKLDTIEIDCNNLHCDLLWRTQVLHNRPVRVVEARMLGGSDLTDGR